jgi:hypothetical protein
MHLNKNDGRSNSDFGAREGARHITRSLGKWLQLFARALARPGSGGKGGAHAHTRSLALRPLTSSVDFSISALLSFVYKLMPIMFLASKKSSPMGGWATVFGASKVLVVVGLPSSS